MKQRKCMNCAILFTPERMGQKACSPRCAYQTVESAKVKAFKAETRRRKRKLLENDKHHWVAKARSACHAYIRERDSGMPCISCGSPAGQCQRHAGHYRPSGANSALRFDERNIFGQCVRCNSHLSGNLVAYRAALIERLGQDVVDWLDNNHETKRWTLDELKQVHKHYTDKLRELRTNHNSN